MPKKLTLNFTTRKDGRVCKRIDGELRTWSDPERARKEVLALIAIREGSTAAADVASVPVPAGPATIRDVFNAFIYDRERKVMDSLLKQGTFLDYKDALDSFVKALNSWTIDPPDVVMAMRKTAPVSALTPKHFAHARAEQARGIKSYAIDRRVQGVRTAFKWAFDVPRMIPVTPHYGDAYRKPSQAEKRKDKRGRAEEEGERRFTPADLKTLLNAPELAGAIKPMVWLALNGGMYAADCATLRWGDVKQEGRRWVIDTYREKTQIRQRFPLWPETVRALDEWRALRPQPKNPAHADLVFVTVRGHPFVHETLRRDKTGKVVGGAHIDAVGQLFRPLLTTLDLKRPGIGFGAFRHTHISAAARNPDVNARMVVRGHLVATIEAHYDFQDTDRLKAVTDTVYATLVKPAFSSKSRPKRAPMRKPSPSPKRTPARRSRGRSAA